MISSGFEQVFPMIAFSPRTLRASFILMSFCPRWTPSDSTIKAISGLSFTMKVAPNSSHNARIFRPSSIFILSGKFFSRNWTISTPPWRADAIASRKSSLELNLSEFVIRYNFLFSSLSILNCSFNLSHINIPFYWYFNTNIFCFGIFPLLSTCRSVRFKNKTNIAKL